MFLSLTEEFRNTREEQILLKEGKLYTTFAKFLFMCLDTIHSRVASKSIAENALEFLPLSSSYVIGLLVCSIAWEDTWHFVYARNHSTK